MKKLLFPLLLISINCFSQQKCTHGLVNCKSLDHGTTNSFNLSPTYKDSVSLSSNKIDTIKAYHVFVDMKTNQVRGYMGYLEIVYDGFYQTGDEDNGFIIKDKIVKSTPLDQRKKPFPKTFILIKSQSFEQETVIW